MANNNYWSTSFKAGITCNECYVPTDKKSVQQAADYFFKYEDDHGNYETEEKLATTGTYANMVLVKVYENNVLVKQYTKRSK